MLTLLRRLTLAFLTLLWIPLLLVVSATILLFNLIHLATRFTRKRPAEERPNLSGRASIIVLNWNGKELLAQGLPSVLDAVRCDGRSHEVIVVDNGSEDGSVDFVRANFPAVRVVALPENLGFAEGNNAGVRAALNDVVVLLNNDMVVDSGFLRPLLEGFGPRTFAVSSQIFLQDPSARREETGKTRAHFRRGMIDYTHSVPPKQGSRSYYPAFWAGGGSSAYDRARFLALGGFSDLYSPMYVEDTDLSYQAWKHGWEVLFAPSSVVYHRHRATSSRRFDRAELEALILRNQLFFIWKNIRSWRMLFCHSLFLPWNCYRWARDHGIAVWLGFLQAIWMLPSVLVARLGSLFRAARSDREIFDLFRNPALYFYSKRRGRAQGGPASERPRVLWVTAYLPHIGRHAGAGRMYQLMRRLSVSYRLTLLTFLEDDSERDFLHQLDGLCDRVVALRRTPPQRWQLYPYEPFEEFRTPEMERALDELLEENDFELIQLEYSQMGCYAMRELDIPNLLTKHEVDFAACLRRMRLQRRMSSRLRWFYNYLQVLDREVKLLRRVDAAICMTDVDAAELRKYCRTIPVHVVNTGVDLEYFAPPSARTNSPRLVFVGAFQHQPNVDAMLYFCGSVLPRVRQKVPAAELCIVGSNPPPAVLDLGQTPGVQVTGFVEDIRPYMASSSVYVVPLRLGVGIRGKILEAWSMGMAVVATSVACAGLRYESGSNLLVADDAELFAAHVVSLLKDAGRRERLGTAGRKLVEEHYDWESSTRELDELYRRYISRSMDGRNPIERIGRG